MMDVVPSRLQQFHYSFEHRPGKNHANADTVTRLPATGCVELLAVFNSWLLIQAS